MGFQSPSAFSAITPTSPNWPPKSLQWVLLGHRGGLTMSFSLISSLPPSGFHAPLFQSLPCPSVFACYLLPVLAEPSFIWNLHPSSWTLLRNLHNQQNGVSSLNWAEDWPPKCTAQSPSLYEIDGIRLCFSQSLKPFFISLSVANFVSHFTEKIKSIPLENLNILVLTWNPPSLPRAFLLQ